MMFGTYVDLVLLIIFWIITFYWFDKEGERGIGRENENAPIYWFTCQMSAAARTESDEGWEQGTLYWSPKWVTGIQLLELSLLDAHLAEGWNWELSWDLNPGAVIWDTSISNLVLSAGPNAHPCKLVLNLVTLVIQLKKRITLKIKMTVLKLKSNTSVNFMD